MTRNTAFLTLALAVVAAAFAALACTGSGGADTASARDAAAGSDQFLQLAESQSLRAAGVDADEARSIDEVLAGSAEGLDTPDADSDAAAAADGEDTVILVDDGSALELRPGEFLVTVDEDGNLIEGNGLEEFFYVEDDQVKLVPSVQPQSTLTAISINESGEIEYPNAQVARTLTAEEELLTGIWTQSINAVVLIATERQRRSFFGFQTPEDATGAGFFWDDEGHIVTNAHVVQTGSVLSEFANDITVTTHSGIEYDAQLIGADLLADLAVLKIDDPTADDSHTLPLGDSSALIPGMTAVALGHPFGTGQDFSMTSGIVSGLNREIQTTGDPNLLAPGVIQTDADVNPGNSGGPLLNSSGEVIGVNTQIRSLDSTNSGVGFALPINLVHRIVDGIIENGAALRSYMGVSMMPVSRIVGLADVPADMDGIYLSFVGEGTPAHVAGLQGDSGYNAEPPNIPTLMGDGDIVIGVNGAPVSEISELRQFLTFNAVPGDVVIVQVRRNGVVINVPITLGSKADFE